MYCPKCGDVMEEKGETFLCMRGNMPLSPRTARQLYASFVKKSQEPQDFTFESRQKRGGNWFCPGCGVRMREDRPGAVRCPQCRRNIGKYLRELVELHPHA